VGPNRVFWIKPIWSAQTRLRFGATRHVASWESGVVPPQPQGFGAATKNDFQRTFFVWLAHFGVSNLRATFHNPASMQFIRDIFAASFEFFPPGTVFKSGQNAVCARPPA
jgi:hypothetical protein